jgi:precorrin-3B C17-methyltransferase
LNNKLYVIGMGPGNAELMSVKADRILKACDTIIGYTVYVDLLKEAYPGKEFLTTPMTQETKRCVMAFEEAQKGKMVAMVCSGDAGVYGMSGLMLEIGADYPKIQVEVVSGVTAALSGGAVLGAPLTHDFAVISLSDRLTPWDKIETRLRMAAQADFSICIYNPSSKGRPDYLKRACDILLEYLPADRICGTVENIGREGEASKLYTLEELRDADVNMFTTVFIGNSMTKEIGGRMVTPRGYRI